MDVTRKSARKWIDSLSLRVQQALFAAATYLILLAICLLAISPEQYDLSVGDVAPKTITASKDIVDELTTERRRQAAADAVSPVYYKDDTVSDTVLSDMDAVFSELRAVRELGEQIRNAWGDEGGSFTEADYAQASGLVTRLSLSNYQLRTLMNTGESDFESLYQSLVSATRSRIVPVAMASGTTILGMLPLLFDSMFGAMAATIMGGLLVATLLTVCVLPVVYAIFYNIRES